MKTIEILGVKVSVITLKDTFKKIEEFIADEKKHQIVSTNTEAITQALHNPQFKAVLNSADLSLPDTYGLLFAAKFLNETSNLKANAVIKPFIHLLIGLKVAFLGTFTKGYLNVLSETISGSNFLFDLLSYFSSSSKPFSIYFVGTKYPNGSESAEGALSILKNKYPNITFVGSVSAREQKEDGSYGFVDPAYVLNKINADLSKNNLKSVDFAFVCFRQITGEVWVSDNLEKLPFKVVMGIGSAFDYVTGRQKRAPLFFRNLKIEWLFRLIADPSIKRLRRILWAFPVFPVLVYLDSLKK